MSGAKKKTAGSAQDQRATYHHGDLKAALTGAALALVSEKGPKGFTLSEAARRAGVSVAAPYRHFADKAHLLAAVSEQGFVELDRALTIADGGVADPRDRVIAIGQAYVRWAVAHPDHYQVMFGAETNKDAHPGLLAAGAKAFDHLLDAIARCQESGVMRGDDARDMAGPMWSMVHGIASLTISGDLRHVGIEEPPEDVARRATNEMLTALAPDS